MQPVLQGLFKRLGAIIRDAVFPARCSSCGTLFHGGPAPQTKVADCRNPTDGFDDELAEFICPDCRRQFRQTPPPICTLCGRFFDSPHGVDHVCGRCFKEPFDFDEARSAGVYDHALKALICSYKYQGRVELAAPLARLLWHTLLRHWDLETIDGIIPVPLHGRRLRQRGFNQAELMLRRWPELARRHGLNLKKETLITGVLIRHRHTRPQTGLDRRQRAANLHRAFRLTDPGAIQGRRLLLVDDVLTTGATANACARALSRADAASVQVLTLAHAAWVN